MHTNTPNIIALLYIYNGSASVIENGFQGDRVLLTKIFEEDEITGVIVSKMHLHLA